MTDSSLKEKTARGLLWGGFSNGMQQLLNLFFGIFLARLLTPADYGMVGMLVIFSSVASALQEGGFIAALTNRKEARHEDYNAVFWFSTLCSVAFYGLLFFCAPLIAGFYHTPQLTPLARLLFLGFVISSLSVAPRACLFRNLRTKETTVISLTSLVVSGVAGITLAANGFAYWGIALQSIVFITMMTLLNFYFSGWRPTLPVSFRPIREMIGFSSKLIVTNLCTIINNNLFSVLLGKFYTEREVGDFTQANKWNSMGHLTIAGMINGIAQPVFARVADDPVRQLAVFRKLLRFTAFVSFPAMLGLSLVAKELIIIAITERWLASACLLQTLCIWGAFVPVINLFSNLVVSRGHSSVYMWSTISLCLVQLAVACMVYPYGLEWMLRLFVGIHIGWLLVWHRFVHKEIGLRLRDMLKDLLPYLLLSLVLVTVVRYATSPIECPWLSLVAKIVLVGGLYALVLWRTRSVIFRESLDFLLKKKIQ